LCFMSFDLFGVSFRIPIQEVVLFPLALPLLQGMCLHFLELIKVLFKPLFSAFNDTDTGQVSYGFKGPLFRSPLSQAVFYA